MRLSANQTPPQVATRLRPGFFRFRPYDLSARGASPRIDRTSCALPWPRLGRGHGRGRGLDSLPGLALPRDEKLRGTVDIQGQSYINASHRGSIHPSTRQTRERLRDKVFAPGSSVADGWRLDHDASRPNYEYSQAGHVPRLLGRAFPRSISSVRLADDAISINMAPETISTSVGPHMGHGGWPMAAAPTRGGQPPALAAPIQGRLSGPASQALRSILRPKIRVRPRKSGSCFLVFLACMTNITGYGWIVG